jgi:hypothetical protein
MAACSGDCPLVAVCLLYVPQAWVVATAACKGRTHLRKIFKTYISNVKLKADREVAHPKIRALRLGPRLGPGYWTSQEQLDTAFAPLPFWPICGEFE